MANAKKLPSGNWRVNIYIGIENGKRRYKSFTAPNKTEAELLAAQYKAGIKEQSEPLNLTVGEAVDKYIEGRDAVLSPSTVREYKQERKNYLQPIMNIRLKELTNEQIQLAINSDAKSRSSKTVQNAYNLLSAALKAYYPGFKLVAALPQKDKTEIVIPEKDVIEKIIKASKGKSVEIPILLTVTLGLRRSEICGLKWNCVNFEDNTITIKKVVVMGENGYVEKPRPKSYAGNRTLVMPDILANKLKEIKPNKLDDTNVVKINGQRIYKNFQKIIEKLNLPHIRFHDLRHYNASVMLMLNIPNKYAAQRMGHSSEDMLKKVYQHLSKRKIDENTNIINSYFNNLEKDTEEIKQENNDKCNTKSNTAS